MPVRRQQATYIKAGEVATCFHYYDADNHYLFTQYLSPGMEVEDYMSDNGIGETHAAILSSQNLAHPVTEIDDITSRENRIKAARNFLEECLLTPTPEAIDQLVEVFLPCLEIICERGYDPKGGLWKGDGPLGTLWTCKGKWIRLWDIVWRKGKRHPDSAFDLINYLGFHIRVPGEGWGETGAPAEWQGK